MKKRGLAGIIYVVLSVLLVILAILLIRIFLLPFFEKQGEITEVKRELLTEEVLFSRVVGPDASGNITLLIYRGQARVNLNSTRIITPPQTVDVFSVTDLSASMNCQAGPSCSNANPAICESPACGGTWLGPMNAAKNVNMQLVQEMLSLEGNQVGLASFSRALQEDTNPNYYHELSSNANSLNSRINSWAPFGGTCTCCGLRKALDNFDPTSTNKKIIVLMSDGAPTEYRAGNCDGPNQLTGNNAEARSQAIAQAQRAFTNDVVIYSIGFGSASDELFLREVANMTNGTYYYADVASITQIYAAITEEIYNTYSTAIGDQFMLLVFYNDETSGTVVYNNPPQNPFETQAYNLISPIPNPQRVEIYLGIRLESGVEVISQFPIDTWEF